MKGARASTAGRRARQPSARPVAMPAWRHHAVVVVFLLLLGALAWRAAYLVTTERSFLVERGEVRALRNVQIPVYRGMIFDRHGEPLAVSAPMHTVWMDPGLARPATLAGFQNVERVARVALDMHFPEQVVRVERDGARTP